MKKKILVIALSIALVATLSMGSLAWFTDSDSIKNDFLVGDSTTDPDKVFGLDVWETVDGQTIGKGDSSENGAKYEAILPGEILSKAPVLENTGIHPMYVRAFVTVSGADILIDAMGGFDWTKTNLFLAGLNTTDWTMEDVLYTVNDELVYVFTYNTALAAKTVSAPLFDSVVIPTGLTKEQAAELDSFSVSVSGQAIQAEHILCNNAVDAFAKYWDAEGTYFGYSEDVADLLIGDGKLVTLYVTNAADLEAAINTAKDGQIVKVLNDIDGDITVSMRPDVKVTIDGDNHKFAGAITVDGKSATYTTSGLTIKDVNFVSSSTTADASIRLGNGTNATRYICNLTVDGCTFGAAGLVGVKSYTGGDKNVVIKDSVATTDAHSLAQLKGVDGVVVDGCKVYSKNGINFNNSDNVVVINSEVSVKGYAVRFGESSGGTGAAETYRIENCSLQSAHDDGDATIILRGTADNATLTLVNTAVADADIQNTATGAVVVK